MKVTAILEHFLSRVETIDRKTTVDRVIAGDPNADIDRCMVTWMPSFRALRQAVERGIRLVICHEPTFWSDGEERPDEDADARAKNTFIKQHGLIILRNHDAWDRWPGIGIPWAWARFLGLGPRPAAVARHGYQHRYDIAPVTLADFAADMAARCESIGEPQVQVVGDPGQTVSRIGIGTGSICVISDYREIGCDCSIVCDDGSCVWQGIQRAEDAGHAVIRVNHGTCEEPGMVTLTEYINSNLTGLVAEHLPHGNTLRLMGRR